MTQVDFYVLKDASEQERLRFACRLTEKIVRMDKKVFIHTASSSQTHQLDDLLWTFQQGSFVPHEVFQVEQEHPAPVQLSHDAEPTVGDDVLINLATDVPLFFSQFERVAELVNQQSDTRTQGRKRYGFYRDRGYPLKTHEINPS